MTDQPEQPRPDVDTAALQLHVAIQELTEPGTAELDRDIPLPGTDAWQLMADDKELEHELYGDLIEAAAGHMLDLASRAVRSLEQLQQRRAARTAPAAPLPSLLHQLQDAIPNGGDSGHSSGPTGAARSPLAVAALDLVTEIAATVGAQRGPRYGHATLTEGVHAWARRVVDDETQVVAAAARATDWPERARQILDPPKRWTTPGACPTCKRTTAYVKSDDGDTVRRPALEFDVAASTARCLCCAARWDGETQLRQLAKVLTTEEKAG